jgi:hypothetical protein
MGTCKTMWTAAVIALLPVVAIGCDNNATGTTIPAPAAAPVAITNANVDKTAGVDPLANVVNRDRILPDPNATSIDPPRAATLVTGFSTMVRESPRGARIETVETTANVNEVSRDGDYYLITYGDPRGSNKTFAGWVYKDALESGQWASQSASQMNSKTPTLTNGKPGAALKLSCAGGQSHVRTTRDFCAATCKDDTGCDAKTAQICDGLAFQVDEKTNATSSVRYCVSPASKFANDAHGPEHGSLPH